MSLEEILNSLLLMPLQLMFVSDLYDCKQGD